jgi:formylmethanofuran dehydrogenase subunit E
MKFDQAITARRHHSTSGSLDASRTDRHNTERTEQIRLIGLKRALQNLEGLHRHLCPRQVLGARIALFAGEYLGLELPRDDKRLCVFVETDGCGLNGIAMTTGTNVGKRTMRVKDYGKVAATFVDTESGEAVRIVPRAGIRGSAGNYAPKARNRWTAQLEGYQLMPTHELLQAEPVQLTVDLDRLISRAGVRVNCEMCGEEIMNEREVLRGGKILCRPCDGDTYFQRVLFSDRLWTMTELERE